MKNVVSDEGIMEHCSDLYIIGMCHVVNYVTQEVEEEEEEEKKKEKSLTHSTSEEICPMLPYF
jgi:hypothetical protein